MTPLTFRRALPADVPALVAIDAHSPGGGWTEAAFTQELGIGWSRVQVACEGGLVVAFMVSWAVADELQLTNIAVHPAHQRRGIARTLLQQLLDEARSKLARVFLEVRRQNLPAQALYRALGFSEVGLRRAYYAHPEDDAVLMEWVVTT